MANVTITGLSPAAALTGTEVLAIDQSGSTVKTTVQDVANLAGGGATLDVVTVGTLGTSPMAVTYTSVAYLNPEAGTQSAPVIDCPSINIGQMGFSGTLSSISFPTLTTGTIFIQGVSTLTSISLPALTTGVGGSMGGSLSFGNNSSLTTIDISSLINIANNSYFGWSGCAFSQTTVDNILVQMVATGAAFGTLQLGGGTSSAPSSIGLAAKATLEMEGWSVTTN